MAYYKNRVSVEELLRLAKERLQGHGVGAATALTLHEAQHLFEELETHQIELEMQNEHLNAARAQLETALNQSSELFDFAPVGIFSLNLKGTIVKLNLAGANLLAGERAGLLGTRFGLYVVDAERPILNDLLEKVMASGDVQSGELTLAKKGRHPTYVQIKIAPLPQGLGWQIILMDITERRQIEKRLRASEERWKLALEAAGDGVWDWQVLTGEVLFSSRFEQLFGFAEHEYGHHLEDWAARLHPDDKARVMADVQACLNGTTVNYASEYRSQCKDGRWKWVLARGTVVSRNEDGKPLRMIGTLVDITGTKQIEEALLVASRFQQAVFDSLSAQIAVLDGHGTILQTNAAWRKYASDIGLRDGARSIGRNYLEVLACVAEKDTDTVAAASAGIASVVSGELPQFQFPQPFFAPADKRWFSMKVTPAHDAAKRIVVSHEDVTNLKSAELAGWTLANIDTLTGALGRRHFLHLAEQELARSRRYELPLMVLMLDLDHFKLVNDRYGHAAGDAVLQGYVQTVRNVLRESDLIGRIGGEEFAVLLPNTAPEGGRALAQRIIESVRANPVEVAGERIAYTVSVGAACLLSETSLAALLGLADTALYRAKHGGRDRLEMEPA